METLFPPKQLSALLRNGKIEDINYTISEIGCYGCIFITNNGENILCNEYTGYLLRTKLNNVDEEGVVSGFATLSSP